MILMEKVDIDLKASGTDHPKTILLWGKDSVLRSAVWQLLLKHNNWDVISQSDEAGLNGLLRNIEEVRPDVVIMYYESKSITHVPVEILKDFPKLLLITFSLENNTLDVYNKKEVYVKDQSDFLAVVEHG